VDWQGFIHVVNVDVVCFANHKYPFTHRRPCLENGNVGNAGMVASKQVLLRVGFGAWVVVTVTCYWKMGRCLDARRLFDRRRDRAPACAS
jgi:hypothetical protein